VVAAVAGTLAFSTLALLVPGALTDGFDAAVLQRLRRAGDPTLPRGGWLVADAARDVTALGGTAVLVLVVAFTAAYLLVDGRRRDACAVVVAAGGGGLLVAVLKVAFDRPRPSAVPHLVVVHSGSFPSGHAMLAAVVYATLGALLARFARRRTTQLLPIGAAVVVALLVGASRVVLGVHHPTDVLAGWAAGTAWAGIAWLVVDRLARTGAVEGRRRRR
jgi:undecaprenyl-diphosphatase